MTQNQAAWIKSSKANPFVVESASIWPLQDNEVLVKNVSVAVNPVDWKIQDSGYFLSAYPNILGEDLAGTVAAVGKAVTNVVVGDRVLGYAIALGLGGSKPAYAAFQHYTVLPDIAVSKLPASVSFDEGSVLPLGMATAAHGLFPPDFLNLARPLASSAPDPALKNKSLLIWGGSSSVGACAVQLAARAGYTVISTASAKNHQLVLSLGADKVFDHSDPEVVAKIKAAVVGEWIGAYDAISEGGTVQKCAEVIGKGLIATTLPPPKDLPQGIVAKGVFAALLITQDNLKEIGAWLFKYIQDGLANGIVKCAPEPLVVRGGLKAVQEGVDLQRKGVSGKKVVVRVDE